MHHSNSKPYLQNVNVVQNKKIKYFRENHYHRHVIHITWFGGCILIIIYMYLFNDFN